jgi:hypothetical protein
VRLAYYSLARHEGGAHERQWINSIRSLRRHNQRLPVWLFVFNGLNDAILREADRWEVCLIDMGPYQDWMQAWHPHGAVLARYPVLHKFLVLGEASAPELSQVLYLDCDTHFFDDLEQLFVPPDQCDWCSREEIGSRLHADGYDARNIDEEAVARICAGERLRWIAPFNTGVCLLNNGVWDAFAELRSTYLDTVWRLMVGQELGAAGSADRDALRAAVAARAGQVDFARALPYPSENAWILEEVATWITLGHIPDLTQQLFTRQAVAQGFECVEALRNGAPPLAAHYFSSLEGAFAQALAEMGARSSGL